MSYYEDCKYFRRGACVNGLYCGYRHNEASCLTERVCNRWAAGCVCDGRCNLRHPSAADLAALAARPPPRARRAPSAHQQQRSPPASTATAAAADTPTAAKAPPCKFHLQGRCVKGSACPFFHAAPAVSLPAPAPAPAPARVAPQRSAGLTLHTAAAAARKAANGRGKLTAAPAIPGRRVEGAAMKRGDSAGEDAVAKAKAAAILQKHRISLSVAAAQAGARGGLQVRGGSAEAREKRLRTSKPSAIPQQRPPPPGGSRASVTARENAHSDPDGGSSPEARMKGRTTVPAAVADRVEPFVNSTTGAVTVVPRSPAERIVARRDGHGVAKSGDANAAAGTAEGGASAGEPRAPAGRPPPEDLQEGVPEKAGAAPSGGTAITDTCRAGPETRENWCAVAPSISGAPSAGNAAPVCDDTTVAPGMKQQMQSVGGASDAQPTSAPPCDVATTSTRHEPSGKLLMGDGGRGVNQEAAVLDTGAGEGREVGLGSTRSSGGSAMLSSEAPSGEGLTTGSGD